jgi:hypothetical protein
MMKRQASNILICLLYLTPSASLVLRNVCLQKSSAATTEPLQNNVHPPSSRRSFLGRDLLCIGFTSALMLGHPATAKAGDDPFAQLDSFASSLSTPETKAAATLPISPSNTSDDETKTATNQAQEPSTSPMQAALEESRKRKRIDPRTHG